MSCLPVLALLVLALLQVQSVRGLSGSDFHEKDGFCNEQRECVHGLPFYSSCRDIRELPGATWELAFACQDHKRTENMFRDPVHRSNW